jgi:hypothetical protein
MPCTDILCLPAFVLTTVAALRLLLMRFAPLYPCDCLPCFYLKERSDIPLKIAVFMCCGAPPGMKDSSENSRDIFIRGGEAPS